MNKAHGFPHRFNEKDNLLPAPLLLQELGIHQSAVELTPFAMIARRAKLMTYTLAILLLVLYLVLAFSSLPARGSRQIESPSRSEPTTTVARPHPPSFDYRKLSNGICRSYDEQFKSDLGVAPIPNIVHYIWLLRDPSQFELSFKVFLSIYSAHAVLRPDRIYIHTDADDSVLEAARAYGTIWTQRVLALPQLVVQHTETLNETIRGVPVEALEHKSDFMRLDVLRNWGGIYLDTDVIVLRDMTDLRRSGFASVVSPSMVRVWKNVVETLGFLNNGVMMATPGSMLIDLFWHASHQFFDGNWTTASTSLLTDLANRLTNVPGQVLVLQPSAFSPVSWEWEDEMHLYMTQSTTASPLFNELLPWGPGHAEPSCADILAWLKLGHGEGVEGMWEWDLISAYVLHGFDNFSDRIPGWDGNVSLSYVLARQSIYSRAVYPLVQHAVEHKVILQDEVEL